ncbi:MAG: ankyrin repeat domain-containing protein [Armatimonadetes bacterium]|nr:ankyrin repeat domain-containing protein [Armatimonadota bacterium]
MDLGLQLQKAIADRDRDSVGRLLDSGLDVNADLGGGLTAIFFAVLTNDRDLLELFVARGADVNARNQEGSTPLHLAVSVWGEGQTVAEKIMTCQLLLERGADVNIRNTTGTTALDECRTADHKELVALLTSYDRTLTLPASGQAPAAPFAPPGSPLEQARLWAEEAVRTQSTQAALDLIDRLPTLQGAAASEALQACYMTALINLAARVRTPQEAEEVSRRLTVTPMYLADRVQQINHMRAMSTAAIQARPARHGRDIAQMIARIPSYSADPELQIGHAQALFQISTETRNGFQSHKLAQEIQRIACYANSEPVQFECAKTLCNATGFAATGSEARTYALAIQGLPFYGQSERIREAHARALRNVERHRDETATSAPVGPGVDLAVGLGRAGKVLVAFLVAMLVFGLMTTFMKSVSKAFNAPPPGSVKNTSKPPKKAPEEPLDLSGPTDVTLEVGKNLERARVELEKGNHDNAAAFARTAHEVALKHKADPKDAVRLLAQIHEEAGEPEKALQYYYDYSSDEKKQARAEKLRLGTEALEKQDYDRALAHARMAVELDKLLGGDGQEGRELKARILEQSGKKDSAIAEYRTLAKQHPEQKEYAQKLEALPLGVANERLAAAEKLLAEGSFVRAEEEGEKAATQFSSLPGHSKDEARARTVMAKAAYSAGRHSDAVTYMKRVTELEPGNAEHRERLENYRKRDHLQVTNDELNRVEKFEFPDPVLTDKRWTYFSIFSADGEEKTLAGAECPLTVAGHYDQSKVSFSVSSGGSYSQGSFGAGGNSVLVPGAYTDDSEYGYGNDVPELSFSAYDMACSGSTGRFVIHEVVRNRSNVERFAADFLLSCGRGKYLFGRVRYNSKFQ